MPAKIALYGYGSAPVIFRHVMDMARDGKHDLRWCAVLTTPHYRALMGEVLPKADILDLFEALPRVPAGGDLDELTNYSGSMCEDLEAEKGLWLNRSGSDKLARGIDYYRLFKQFLTASGATHLLSFGLETPDAKILIAVARELGLGLMVATDLRNLTGTMFASDALETPPAHARATPVTRQQAQQIVAAFRAKWTPPRSAPRNIDPATDDNTLLDNYLPPLRDRIVRSARMWRERPDLFDPVYIRDSVLSNSKLLQNILWGPRARLNARNFHIGSPAELPKKFIFYPLQYTPESSINTPAPYFVDQFRVIDAVRLAMPSNYTLVVKEHWSCLPVRPLSFMRRIMRLAGVAVANYRMPASALVERAGLTISVTGTATFEAFLSGHSAMALGPGLCAWSLGGVAPLGELGSLIRSRLGNPVPEATVIERVATLLDARYPFFHGSAHMPGEPVLRRGNIARLLEAILDHLGRARPVQAPAIAEPAGQGARHE